MMFLNVFRIVLPIRRNLTGFLCTQREIGINGNIFFIAKRVRQHHQ